MAAPPYIETTTLPTTVPIGSSDALARDVAGILSESLPLQAIVLFGSRARGNARADSDIDLLLITGPAVVGQAARDALYRRACELLWHIKTPIDLLVCSPEQVARWRSVPAHVIGRAVLEGQVLYGQF